MSVISNIISQRLWPTSDLPSGMLMRWTEPTALYERKRQRAFYFIWPFIPLSVVIIVFLYHPHGMKIGLMLFLLAIALFAGVLIIFARRLDGSAIELKEDGIYQRTGGSGPGAARASGSWSAYADIECCTVHRDSCKGAKFAVLRLKNKHKFINIVGPVTLTIVPQEINLESVFKIFRDKGVQIFEK
jgi:hypothetical protein